MTTYTLISAAPGDSVPGGAELADPECPVDWDTLPAPAQTWALRQGYLPDDPDELLYVVEGAVELIGWETLTLEF